VLRLSVVCLYGMYCGKTVHCTIRYDRVVQKLSVCDPLNLAYETKTKNASAQLVQTRLKIREGRLEGIKRLWSKGFVKEMSFKRLRE